jgi:hypothetical protein
MCLFVVAVVIGLLLRLLNKSNPRLLLRLLSSVAQGYGGNILLLPSSAKAPSRL